MPRLDYSITNKDKHLSQQQQHHHHGFHMYMWSAWSCTCKWCEHFVTAFCCSQDARDPFRVPSSLCVYVVVIKTIYSVPFKVFPKMYNAQHLLRIASPLHKVKLVHTCADSTTWNRVCLYIRVVGIASSLYICIYIYSINHTLPMWYEVGPFDYTFLCCVALEWVGSASEYLDLFPLIP